MPKQPKHSKTSRRARANTPISQDLSELSVASTSMSTIVTDTETKADPTPTLSSRIKGRESKKPTQKPSAGRAVGQQLKAKPQKVIRKSTTGEASSSERSKVISTASKPTKGRGDNRKKSAEMVSDAQKLMDDMAELSKSLQARFSVSDETMVGERERIQKRFLGSAEDTAALVMTLRSASDDFQMGFNGDLEMLGAAVENIGQEHTAQMSQALAELAVKMKMETEATLQDMMNAINEGTVLIAGNVEDQHDADTLVPDLKQLLQNHN
ncbi:hypothetical protein EMPS_00470 [Entomortierella parvispora]|uniref:Uncharacterized protein n=1 Tax=Entomortierella parvispora TaxID=205924 RepID=A0A9P3LRR9_9FUNG|nr:hypothetical protein EMPS_00470 [Entomortierella parvispora]